MTRKLAFALTAFATLAVGVTAAFAGTNRTGADPGVTSTSILLGATTPLSGPYSSVSSVTIGANAYFKYVNARGGVHGRQITFKYLDDTYTTSQTVQQTRQLVEQDKVFAIFNAIGTEHNLAVRDYLNANKVPQIFAASGSTTLGTEGAKYPYTIGFQPSYLAEGWVYGKYLARTRSGAKVAVLFQNDDYGKDLLNGLKKGLQRSKVKVVAARAVRGDGRGRPGSGREAEGVRRGRLRDFRGGKVPDPGLRDRQQARLEAEARAQQHRLVGLERHDDRGRGRARTSSWTSRSRSSS